MIMYSRAPTHAEPGMALAMDRQIVSSRGIMVATQRESPIAEVGPMRATLASWMDSAEPLPFASCSSMPIAMPLQIEPT